MLANLTVQDIVLIDRLGIEFDAGLTVLTGETGAGKSILLDALSLALGSRGDAQLIRAGAERGQVTAVFEPPPEHPALGRARRERDRGGRRGDPQAHADARRQIARLHQRPGLQRGAPARRSARCWWRSTASTTTARWSAGRSTGACSTLSAGSKPDVAEVAARYPPPERAGAGGGRAEGRARRGAARRRLSARRGRGAGRAVAGAGRGGAPRRAAPLPDARGEDRRRAQRGARARRRAMPRRCRRSSAWRGGWSARRADMAGLLDGTLSGPQCARSTIWRRRGAGSRTAIRQCAFDPGELERTEERLFALRAAARKHQVMWTTCPRSRPSSPPGSPRSISAASG